MRISGWSSDVCSSDLAAVRQSIWPRPRPPRSCARACQVHLPGPGEYRAKPGWLAEPSRAAPANRARRRLDKLSRPPAELRLMFSTAGGIQEANDMCKQTDSNSDRVQRNTNARTSTREKVC